MNYDTPWAQELPKADGTAHAVQDMVKHINESYSATVVPPAKRKRGGQLQVSWEHLCLSILSCFLFGWHAQLEVWRFLATQPIGRFACILLTDQAIYKRLGNGGAQAMHRLCQHVCEWIFQSLAPYEDRSLAPHFREIRALDESKLDPVKRWIKEVRDLPDGDLNLLAGRLSGLLDVRRQCFVRLELLPEAMASSLEHAKAMVSGLAEGTLLLFDLGYYAFEWFDDLTRQGIAWVSRVRSNGSFEIKHVLISREGYSEALAWMGAYRTDRAAFLVRLICFRYQGRWYRYVTNVLDPAKLSGADVARLYARRWDIELAFRLLKDHLNLRMLWSAKPQVITVQVWASVILAQLFHSYQVRVAAQAGVEVFDVSLDLLVRYVPRLMAQGVDPVAEIVRVGRSVGMIRPSTRIRRIVPEFALFEYDPPPGDLPREREPRYGHRPAGNRNRKKKASV